MLNFLLDRGDRIFAKGAYHQSATDGRLFCQQLIPMIGSLPQYQLQLMHRVGTGMLQGMSQPVDAIIHIGNAFVHLLKQKVKFCPKGTAPHGSIDGQVSKSR